MAMIQSCIEFYKVRLLSDNLVIIQKFESYTIRHLSAQKVEKLLTFLSVMFGVFCSTCHYYFIFSNLENDLNQK